MLARVEEASEPDDFGVRVVEVPDEVRSLRERDPSEGLSLTGEKLAAECRKCCEALTYDEKLLDERDYPGPITIADEQIDLPARVVIEWLRELDACQRSGTPALRERVREDALDVLPRNGLHLARDVVVERLGGLLELPTLG